MRSRPFHLFLVLLVAGIACGKRHDETTATEPSAPRVFSDDPTMVVTIPPGGDPVISWTGARARFVSVRAVDDPLNGTAWVLNAIDPTGIASPVRFKVMPANAMLLYAVDTPLLVGARYNALLLRIDGTSVVQPFKY